MRKWLFIAACTVLPHALAIAEVDAAQSVSCKLQHPSRYARARWRLASFEMKTRSIEDPSRSCGALLESMQRSLERVAPPGLDLSSGPIELHVWLEEVSTDGTVRFEARAWAISSNGRHLRHITRALAAGKRSSRRDRIARSALSRALSDLVAIVRRAAT